MTYASKLAHAGSDETHQETTEQKPFGCQIQNCIPKPKVHWAISQKLRTNAKDLMIMIHTAVSSHCVRRIHQVMPETFKPAAPPSPNTDWCSGLAQSISALLGGMAKRPFASRHRSTPESYVTASWESSELSAVPCFSAAQACH